MRETHFCKVAWFTFKQFLLFFLFISLPLLKSPVLGPLPSSSNPLFSVPSYQIGIGAGIHGHRMVLRVIIYSSMNQNFFISCFISFTYALLFALFQFYVLFLIPWTTFSFYPFPFHFLSNSLISIFLGPSRIYRIFSSLSFQFTLFQCPCLILQHRTILWFKLLSLKKLFCSFHFSTHFLPFQKTLAHIL